MTARDRYEVEVLSWATTKAPAGSGTLGHLAAQMQRAAAYCANVASERNAVIGVVGPSGGEGARTVSGMLAESLAFDFQCDVLSLDTISSPPSSSKAKSDEMHGMGSRVKHAFVPVPPADVCRKWVSDIRESSNIGVLALPPVLAESSALRIARYLDGIILVLDSNTTRWQVAKAAQGVIRDAGGKCLGVILNKRRRVIPDAIYRLL